MIVIRIALIHSVPMTSTPDPSDRRVGLAEATIAGAGGQPGGQADDRLRPDTHARRALVSHSHAPILIGSKFLPEPSYTRIESSHQPDCPEPRSSTCAIAGTSSSSRWCSPSWCRLHSPSSAAGSGLTHSLLRSLRPPRLARRRRARWRPPSSRNRRRRATPSASTAATSSTPPPPARCRFDSTTARCRPGCSTWPTRRTARTRKPGRSRSSTTAARARPASGSTWGRSLPRRRRWRTRGSSRRRPTSWWTTSTRSSTCPTSCSSTPSAPASAASPRG